MLAVSAFISSSLLLTTTHILHCQYLYYFDWHITAEKGKSSAVQVPTHCWLTRYKHTVATHCSLTPVQTYYTHTSPAKHWTKHAHWYQWYKQTDHQYIISQRHSHSVTSLRYHVLYTLTWVAACLNQPASGMCNMCSSLSTLVTHTVASSTSVFTACPHSSPTLWPHSSAAEWRPWPWHRRLLLCRPSPQLPTQT